MKTLKKRTSRFIVFSILTIVVANILFVIIRWIFGSFEERSCDISLLDGILSYIFNDISLLDGILSYISIIAAIVIAIILYEQSENISSLGNYVRLQTKKEVMSLLQALDNIQFIEQCLKHNMPKKDITLEYELECIDKFLCSPTSKFVAEVLDKREKCEGGADVFLVQLLLIRYNPDKLDLVEDVMNKLLSLSPSDFKTMDNIAENLNRNFCEWYKNQTYLSKKYIIEEPVQEGKSIEKFFVWLCEEKHIEDPDVELFYAVSKNDVELVRKALAEGADKTVTDQKLVRKYQAEYDEYMNIINKKEDRK